MDENVKAALQKVSATGVDDVCAAIAWIGFARQGFERREVEYANECAAIARLLDAGRLTEGYERIEKLARSVGFKHAAAPDLETAWRCLRAIGDQGPDRSRKAEGWLLWQRIDG